MSLVRCVTLRTVRSSDLAKRPAVAASSTLRQSIRTHAAMPATMEVSKLIDDLNCQYEKVRVILLQLHGVQYHTLITIYTVPGAWMIT